jgi:hypothetical protein
LSSFSDNFSYMYSSLSAKFQWAKKIAKELLSAGVKFLVKAAIKFTLSDFSNTGWKLTNSHRKLTSK